MAQCLSYTLPDTFYVCQNAPFEITVSNPDGTPMTDIKITVEMTTQSGTPCGIRYEAGSVTGAMESDISNPESPVFEVPALAPGATQVICLEMFAPCDAIKCIDDAELFKNNVSITSSNCNEQIATLPYEVRTARLVITNIANTLLTGSQGDILSRNITVRNTRQGSLTRFVFSDEHQGGISISTLEGNVLFSGATALQIELTESDFVNQGIGTTFDFNETFVIHEKILVEACGFDTTSTLSNIIVDWGCDSQGCQMETGTALVKIDPTDLVPELVFTPIPAVPTCFCGPEPVTQAMTIANVGDGSAFNFVLYLHQISPTGGIDLNSFRMDSLGTNIPLSAANASSFFDSPDCDLPDDLFSKPAILIPQISPGATMTVFWDVYFCQNTCNRPGENWSYRYEYNKTCPPDQFFSLPDTIGVKALEPFLNVSLSSENNTVYDQLNNEIFYTLNYDYLDTTEDSLFLEIYLPCGLNWDPENTLEMDGQTPLISGPIQIGDSTLYIAQYDLPFSGNSANTSFSFIVDCEAFNDCATGCRDSLVTSCGKLDNCFNSSKIGTMISVNTFVQNCQPTDYHCGISTCNTLTLQQECYDVVCITPIPGYVDLTFSGARITLGLGDNDNDHFPDAPLPDPALIRKDRLIIGDTFTTHVEGVVITEDPNTSFSEGYVDINIFGTDVGLLNQKLLSPEGVESVYGRLEVYDQSADTWYVCDAPELIVRDIPLRYSYKLTGDALVDCGAPAGFVLEAGDSVRFDGAYRVIYNLTRDDSPFVTWPLMAVLNIRPTVPVFNPTGETVERDTVFQCGCGKLDFELSGINYRVEPGVFAIPPCDTSNFTGASLFQVQLQFPDFFPYEYRNVAELKTWEIKMPDAIQPVETLLKYIRFQDGINYLEEKPLLPVQNNQNYTYDLSDIQSPYPPEEGYLSLIQYRFTGDCDISGGYNMGICGFLDFHDDMKDILDTLTVTSPGNSALRALIPNLILTDTFCIDTTAGNINTLNFKLYNLQTTISSQKSGTAENAWLFPVSSSGQIEDFTMTNLGTGMNIPVVNGIFQLGGIPPGDTLHLQLSGVNGNCDNETLTLRYGWNCTPFTNPVNLPCYVQEKPYDIITFPGVLDLFVTSPGQCSDLCDTIPYHQINIFNADRGSVFDLMVTGIMPPGTGVLPNTSEIEYPAGSGNFMPIADPVSLGGATVKWNVLPELPGFDRAPLNAVNLRFLGMDSCSFVSGSFPVFTAFGSQNCGDPTNRIAESADPLCTNGISAPYSTTIDVQESPAIECNDVVNFTVAIEATGATQPGDCVIITFPPGIDYVANSCTPFLPFTCNCTYENSQLTCPLPANIPAGTLLAFEFQAAGFSALPCDPAFLIFQTAGQTVANCVAIGDTCSTKVGTGSLLYELKIERPVFELSAFQINAFQTGGDDLIEFSINLTNAGDADAPPPTIVDFYLDTDGNGNGDVWVHSASLDAPLPAGETTTITGSFEAPPGNLCGLIALIDAQKHCACGVDQIAAEGPFIYHANETFVTCSGAPVQIGVPPQNGVDYQWEGDDLNLLDCTTCPLTGFSKINDDGDGLADTLHYSLLAADAAGCIIQNQIEVIVQPQPGIIFATTQACPGEPVNICATTATVYLWSGPGVVQGQQCQTVFPTQTATYSVTLSDSEGCIGADTVLISINDLPVAFAGNDTTFCSNKPAQLQAFFDADYEYLWSPGMPYLSNPFIPNPTILQPLDTTYTLTVINQAGCKNTDEVAVQFAPGADLSLNVEKDTICAGESLVLEAAGAGIYTWSPAGNCLNNDCSMVEIAPTATTTYTLVGSFAGQCSDTVQVTIEVGKDTTIFQSPQEICAGDSILLFGEWVTEAGTYCDTVFLSSGCKNLTCVELTTLPTPETPLDLSICAGESVVVGNQIYTETGQYTDILTAQNGCDSIVLLDLTVIDLPEVQIAGPDEVSIGTPVELSVEDLYDTYQWLANDEELAGCFGQPDCLHDFPDTTTVYTVFVGQGPCTDSTKWNVAVLDFCDVTKAHIPTAFTPDNDNLNETFSIVEIEDGNFLRLISLEIWSRWGEKIYEGSGPDAAWDGTYKGKPAASDVYVYIIWVGCRNDNGEIYRYVGDVTLLR